MFVLGIAGKAGSGKDTCAHFFELRGFTRYAFADPLKRAINPLFGWDYRHGFGELKEEVDPFWGVSPRYVYQTFGTDWAREFVRQDFWIRVAEKRLKYKDRVVIPDVRFDDEANWVREHGAMLYLHRTAVPKIDEHKSEDGIAVAPEDHIIFNNGTFTELEDELSILYNDFIKPRL